MNIDFNRICQLAGVTSKSSRTVLREGKEEEEVDLKKEMYEDMEEGDYMHEEEDADEGHYMEAKDEDDEDEMVEVDVSELMSEIRRAKYIMNENKKIARRKAVKQKKLQESRLKRVIAREVQSVLAEMDDHDSSWLYGKRKPRHSRRGYTNQGRSIPGIGFRKY